MGVVLTLAFFLSGFFVVLTPLPLLYFLLRNPKRALWAITPPALSLLVLIYLVFLMPLHAFYEAHPGWSWLLPVPGMNLLDFVSPRSVAVFGLTYFLFYVALSFLLSRVLTAKERPFKLFLTGCFVLFIAGLFLYGAYAAAVGRSPFDFLSRYFRQAVEEFIRLQNQGDLALEQVTFLKQNVDALVHYSLVFSPSLFFCAVLLFGGLNLVLGKRLFAPFVPGLKNFNLTDWPVSFYGVWIVIACLTALLGNIYLLHSPYVMPVAANALIVFACLYYLQGLAVIVYHFDQKNVRPFLRLVAYSLILLLFQTVGLLIMGIGFLDSWFNFRRLKPKAQKG